MKLYCVYIDGHRYCADKEIVSSLLSTHNLWSQGITYETVVYDKTKNICEAYEEGPIGIVDIDDNILDCAHEMLEALEGAKWAMDSYICAQLREKMDEYQDVVQVIQKARGEE